LSLRYTRCGKHEGAKAAARVKKYFRKVLDKRMKKRYYIKADSHRELQNNS